ncbi:MAG: GGDEF domain-containing protein [Planctomycetes bacterium]|jgi:diguanylate cyclase (GGDEF)-like protein|nr:GGDEF domain-containing protein [Planctomycetota bacterium]
MSSTQNPNDHPPAGNRPDDDGDKTIILNARELLEYQEQMRQDKRKVGSLLVIDGTQADLGHHAAVDAEVVIGREPGGLSLRDRKCSRRHAAVARRGDLYVVRDIGSTNGTLLNGVTLTGEQPLRDGDRIVIGQTVIKFTIVDDAEVGYLRQVEQLVLTDDLTGLMAKHRFDAALADAIESTIAAGQPLCAIMMDMDGLKAINDRHGHQVGAFTIGRVGVLIGRILASRGEACRFGGDEFSAFVPRAGLAAAMEISEHIRREVEAMDVVYGPVTVKARISIGVAERPEDVTDVDRLLALADQALYRAKAKGRNRVSD